MYIHSQIRAEIRQDIGRRMESARFWLKTPDSRTLIKNLFAKEETEEESLDKSKSPPLNYTIEYMDSPSVSLSSFKAAEAIIALTAMKHEVEISATHVMSNATKVRLEVEHSVQCSNKRKRNQILSSCKKQYTDGMVTYGDVARELQ